MKNETEHPISTSDSTATGKLGTFSGVFTPSILTILGIILFLRLGYVAGAAGLMQTVVILLIANAISILTTLSLSAIATNFKVKGGGDYYLISRTLGVEFGGSIGIVLFMAQSVSIAFYCIGFGEALCAIFTGGIFDSPKLISLIAVLFLFIFAWLGSDWASKFQFGVMALLVLALLSFFIGGIGQWEASLFIENWHSPAGRGNFWILFAIFFPAVTGFTQGVSMSGDLKDPGKSLPRGTFTAVFLSMAIYFAVVIVFAGALTLQTLATDYTAMKQVAFAGWMIDAGVIAATLSSAMASFLGAPRILQSLSSDKIFTFLAPFAKGHGPSNNPRKAVLLSAIIALITISAGNLNFIAPVVSMFFLISYGLLNYATYYEAKSASPSFRPRFRWFDKRLSLFGCIACLGVMLAIDFSTGIISVAILFAIYQYLKRTAGPARWADGRRSYYLQQVRKNLLLAEEEIEHPRDWSPRILAFSNDSARRRPLLEMASWLVADSGMVTAVKIIEGSGGRMLKLKNEAEDELRKDIDTMNIDAFHLVIAAPELQVGLQTLIQSFGIGPIHANTVLLNWLDRIPRGIMGVSELDYIKNLRTAFRFGCNIAILDAKTDEWNALLSLPGEKREIAVVWNDDPTSEMMLILAHQLTLGAGWSGAGIRVYDFAPGEAPEKKADELKQRLEEFRITARPVVVTPENREACLRELGGSAITFLPFQFRSGMIRMPLEDEIETALNSLKVVVMVMAAEDIDLDAGPEDGRAAELAAAKDEADKKKKVAEKANRDAEDAAGVLNALIDKLDHHIASNADETEITAIVSEIRKARSHASETARRAITKHAIAENVAADADSGISDKSGESGKPEGAS